MAQGNGGDLAVFGGNRMSATGAPGDEQGVLGSV